MVLLAIDVNAAEKIKVGTNATYPPFEYIDEKTGQPTGFEIELIKLLLEKNGYEVEVVDMDFDGLITSLTTKKIDVIAASMSATPKRKQVVSFSDEYSNDEETGWMGFYVKADNETIKGEADLKGKKVAAELGTFQSDYVAKIRGVTVVNVSGADLYAIVGNNKADAALLLHQGAEDYISKTKDPAKQIKHVGKKIKTPGAAFAVRKGEDDLLQKLNATLKAVKANGEYNVLSERFLTK
jgi:polar amino acid transport system substrate-binding protein